MVYGVSRESNASKRASSVDSSAGGKDERERELIELVRIDRRAFKEEFRRVVGAVDSEMVRYHGLTDLQMLAAILAIEHPESGVSNSLRSPETVFDRQRL